MPLQFAKPISPFPPLSAQVEFSLHLCPTFTSFLPHFLQKGLGPGSVSGCVWVCAYTCVHTWDAEGHAEGVTDGASPKTPGSVHYYRLVREHRPPPPGSSP